ncbi:hypothetical protein LguiB_000009 [Lonicera macranthoides]
MEAVRRSKYECLLFDMDDTLYPMSLGLNFACRKNIEEFMLQQLHIEADEVPRMCLELYKEHGTTMAGLKALGYDFDNDEFHADVHGKLHYESLKPDPVLRNLLISMPQRKIIFTNADKAHATKVLKRLGLEDCFEGVICFETLNPPPRPIHQDDCTTNTTTGVGMDDNYAPLLTTEAKTPIDNAANNNNETESDDASSHLNKQILCKPALEAVKAAIKIANVDTKRTIFFDDSARNIASGKAAGLHTVIVGSSTLVPGADHALSSIHNIKDILPELWEDDEGEHLEQVVQSTTVEAAVLA